MNQFTTGQVLYGKTNSYGSATPAENSYNYNDHTQPLTNLEANTKYYFKVLVKAQNGATAERT